MTTNNEPTVQVPVSWLRDAVVSIKCEQYDGPLVRRLEALLSQPTPTAEPESWCASTFPGAPEDQCSCHTAEQPRIEDMAPGTTFWARFVNGTADRHFEFTATTIPVRLIPSRLTYWPSDIDPSTIRDVTPPQ